VARSRHRLAVPRLGPVAPARARGAARHGAGRAQLRRRAHHAPHERLDDAGTSANAEIAPAIATLRNRSRDQVRNNPYARRAIAKLVSASIGTGIMARPPEPVAKVWKRWCKQATSRASSTSTACSR
jgi:capsid protein